MLLILKINVIMLVLNYHGDGELFSMVLIPLVKFLFLEKMLLVNLLKSQVSL